MNRHLNLFRAFSQEQSKENIEDNLSRALVLCLKDNTLFFHEFLKTIIASGPQGNDYDYLFANDSQDNRVDIDIQIDVTSLNDAEFKRIYAVAVTTEELDMLGFFDYKFAQHNNYRPITDIFITVNDIAFVFEVKRWGEDCRQQLYNQIYKLTTKDEKEEGSKTEKIQNKNLVIPISLDWKAIMLMVTRINNFCNMVNTPSVFLKDFINLVYTFNNNWLPITPFSSISNSRDMDAKRQQRLIAAINQAPEYMEPLNYNDRVGFGVNFGWAKEILPYFERDLKDNLTLNTYVWPGNTKGQGWKVFYSDKIEDLSSHKEVKIDDETFPVQIENELKFCHFNKYISGLDFKDNVTSKELVNTANFEKFAGKHNREDWPKLEAFFDEHFKPEFDWREHSGWIKNFVNTNRTYLTLAIGYQVRTKIPYEYLQNTDKKEADLEKVSKVFEQIHEFYKNLL